MQYFRIIISWFCGGTRRGLESNVVSPSDTFCLLWREFEFWKPYILAQKAQKYKKPFLFSNSVPHVRCTLKSSFQKIICSKCGHFVIFGIPVRYTNMSPEGGSDPVCWSPLRQWRAAMRGCLPCGYDPVSQRHVIFSHSDFSRFQSEVIHNIFLFYFVTMFSLRDALIVIGISFFLSSSQRNIPDTQGTHRNVAV
jgi:hypothetical protein